MKYAILNTDQTSIIAIQDGIYPYKSYKLFSQLTDGQKDLIDTEIDRYQAYWYLFDEQNTLIHQTLMRNDMQLQDNILVYEGNEQDPRIVAYELQILKNQKFKELMTLYKNIKGSDYFVFKYNNTLYPPKYNENIDWWINTIKDSRDGIAERVTLGINTDDTRFRYNTDQNEWTVLFPLNGIVLPFNDEMLGLASLRLSQYKNSVLWDAQHEVMKVAINNATTLSAVQSIQIAFRDSNNNVISKDSPYVFDLDLL